jgi:hypothetical protein
MFAVQLFYRTNTGRLQSVVRDTQGRYWEPDQSFNGGGSVTGGGVSVLVGRMNKNLGLLSRVKLSFNFFTPRRV